ncbi:uroporphyrinogen-III C-methyltransferase [Sphingomonas sp. G-3-2-10]|uniref:uroporphyrinogen-III C-methyltransferase n=1 Tax=Sphingomonas sp. G-3-2-10 TaxID=2728838 RepID=UPI00146B71AF|nr:uroporphyrinogen-III C-methyltransferase [Sphingomonas sp. G-3-2-10]NML08247.1 uroporphyrinogen-III C-methyltransferase [Sphingomonas sp. G-3-2-10]
MADEIALGEVWLVGAGPGDPDLLTRKAERLIRAASIVFYDALVGPGVLDLIPPHVRRLAVGKRSGRHSKDQGSINDLLLAAAQDGERVVRLKGGDPSVFGRSAEEMAHLRAEGISVRICPGITAASAAAASAGVSLTLRGLSRRLQFVTAHARAGEALALDWSALADPGATLAVYMGREAARDVARQLMAKGMPAQTPVLIAANVSLPDERLLFTRLDLLHLGVTSIASGSPALLLVGEAVGAGDRSGAMARQHSEAVTQ